MAFGPEACSLPHLIRWARSHGAQLGAVELRAPTGTSTGRGLFAKQDLAADALVLRLPRSLLLSWPPSDAALPLATSASFSSGPKLLDQEALALVLARHSLCTVSVWRDCVPPLCAALAALFLCAPVAYCACATCFLCRPYELDTSLVRCARTSRPRVVYGALRLRNALTRHS